MRAIFLKRNYIEKSKKSGKSMTVLDVFELPKVINRESGEISRGQTRSIFVMAPNHFDLGKMCKLGDVIDIVMEYDEDYDRGFPVGVKVIKSSPYSFTEGGLLTIAKSQLAEVPEGTSTPFEG